MLKNCWPVPVVLLLIITGTIAFQTDKSPKHPQNIFANSYFAIMDEHDDMIDIIGGLISSGRLDNTPKTLIQVDYHSDLNRNNRHIDENYVTQGNWINVLMSKGVVNKIYWVLPDRTQNVDALRKNHWEGQTPWLKSFFKGGSPDQMFHVDNNTGKIYFDEISSGNQYTKVEFHKLILKDLPDFKKDNEQIILSIDADFFDGVDSLSEFPNQSVEKVRGKLDSFLSAIDSAGVRPVFVGCARSKTMVGDFLEEIEKFCQEIGSASLAK